MGSTQSLIQNAEEGARLWITGVAGFIGRAVLLEARRQSRDLHISGIGRGLEDTGGLLQASLDVALSGSISITTLDELATASGLPTQVIHLAASSSVGRSFEGPVQDFRNTVDGSACLFHWLGRNAPQARVVLASSAAVYGAGHDGPIREVSPCNPTSPYGWHKKIVEYLGRCETQTSGLRVLPARVFSAYGPGLQRQLFWDITEKLEKDPTVVRLMGTGCELRDWCHVSDVARALLDLVSSAEAFDGPMQPVNISSGRGVSVASAVRAFCAAFLPIDARAPRLSFSQEQRVGDPISLIGSPGRLKGLGLTSPRAFPADLKDTAAWCRKEVQNDPCRFHSPFGKHLDGGANVPIQPRVPLS